MRVLSEFFFFDNELSFKTGPSLQTGFGYNIKHFLQLSLSFNYAPTQQQISAAASKITTNFSVYQYFFTLKFRKQSPLVWQVMPFMTVGGGGIIFDPQTGNADSLDVGGGQMVPRNLTTDHKLAINIGGGFAIPLSRVLLLNLEYRKYFYQLNLNDGTKVKTVSANNQYLGAKFTVAF